MASQPPPPESAPPAPSTIFSIGEDLLLEIFVRLPSLPTLVRAAFACRSFLHAVRSFPTFRPRFRALHPPPLIGLFLRNRDGDIPSFAPLRARAADPDHAALLRGSDFFLTRVPDDKGFWHINHCHDGYLLLHNWKRMVFVAYNPLAGVLHQIPNPPEAVRDYHILSSPEERHRHGSFRLVCVHEDGLQVRPVVYSSDTGEWRVLPWMEAATISKDHPDDDEHFLPPWRGKLVNGRIYWTSYHFLIVLDAATLQFSSIDLPPVMYGEKSFVVGDTKDEKLCVVCVGGYPCAQAGGGEPWLSALALDCHPADGHCSSLRLLLPLRGNRGAEKDLFSLPRPNREVLPLHHAVAAFFAVQQGRSYNDIDMIKALEQ